MNKAAEHKVPDRDKQLRYLDRMTMKLQSTETSLPTALVYFGGVLMKYPSHFVPLNAHVNIDCDPCSESKLLKIQEGSRPCLIQFREKKSRCFLKTTAGITKDDGETVLPNIEPVGNRLCAGDFTEPLA